MRASALARVVDGAAFIGGHAHTLCVRPVEVATKLDHTFRTRAVTVNSYRAVNDDLGARPLRARRWRQFDDDTDSAQELALRQQPIDRVRVLAQRIRRPLGADSEAPAAFIT